MMSVFKLLFKHIYLLLLLPIILFASFALLHAGMMPTHDGEYHVLRFYEFYKTLSAGDWYPRWAADFNAGYGIPLFNYVYPFPNYFAAFLHVFGVSFIDAFKLNMFVAFFIAGISFYFWTREFFDDAAGFVGAVFYTFSPYFFVDTYIRGSVGEVWALALFPAFLYTITKLFFKKNKLYLFPSAGLLALIIFSHNILGLVFFIFTLFYIIFLIFQTKDIIKGLAISGIVILLGLALSAIFWLPALLETGYVKGLQVFDLRNNFPDLYQLLFPSWGSGIFGITLSDEMSVQIGVANLLIFLASIITTIILFRRKNILFRISFFFLIAFLVVFSLMLPSSYSIWQSVPLMHYFQFPWRLLSLEILICSFLAASVCYILCQRKGNAYTLKSKILIAVMVIGCIFLCLGYNKPDHYLYRQDTYYTTRSNFIDGTNSPGNVFNTIWIKSVPMKKESSKIQIIKGLAQISDVQFIPTYYIFTVSVTNDAKVLLQTAYFPGWSAKIDKIPAAVQRTKDGSMTIQIPKGKHTVEVKFANTLVRTMAEDISFFTFFFMVFFFLNSYFLNRKIK